MLTPAQIMLDEAADRARRLASAFPGRTFCVIRTIPGHDLQVVNAADAAAEVKAGRAYYVVIVATDAREMR